MTGKVVILDGYVDEPAMLGVPPYMSPLARYAWGAMANAGWTPSYVTIDGLRAGRGLPEADMLAVIHGAIVPGKYLRGMPISRRELTSVSRAFRGVKIVGGAAARFSDDIDAYADFDFVVKKDMDAALADYAAHNDIKDRWRTPEEWSLWALSGACAVREHPDYPQPLVAEVDTSRGCVRYFHGGCSFCSEPSYGRPLFRKPEDVAAEVGELAKAGVQNFRLGGQACIYSYMAEGVGKTETPKPNTGALRRLLEGVRHAAPDLRVLHLDNANPAVVATHPEESRKATELFVKHCTSGNVLAFGLESADPSVKDANNLNASAEQTAAAVRLMNEVGGSKGENGLPRLLPGINILSGLDGENKGTFRANYAFLKGLLDDGLLIRRINIRQVSPCIRDFDTRRHYGEFRRFKERVRREIDAPMLARLAPKGTVVRGVYLEITIGGSTFGRQPGSYPILCGLPYQTDTNRFVDILITRHGYKSIIGVETPLDINRATMGAIEALPGVGRKRATRIMAKRPYDTLTQLSRAMDDPSVSNRLIPYICLRR
jgi:radical SAM superfamily enzyme with C-terminal helix-hairpin-helix motif